MPLIRPASVPRSQVWRRFKGIPRSGRPAQNYLVKDLDVQDKERCLDLMQESFLRDEPLCAAFEIPADPASMSTIRDNWSQDMDEGFTLVCCTDEDGRPGEMVGFCICKVLCQDDDQGDLDEIKGENWKKLLTTLIAIEQSFNLYQHYGLDKYFSACVLVVLPEHRGQNIGAELFLAGELLAKAAGLSVSTAMCTAVESQRLAEKCSYDVLHVFPYSNMLKYGFDLSECPTQSAKIYGKLLQDKLDT